MATTTTPQHAYLSSLISGTAMGRSANLSIALSIGGFEGFVPVVGVQPNTTALSAGFEVYAYRSTDGGATYETVPTAGFTIARSPNTPDRRTMRLGSGTWAIRVISGGSGSAVTFSFSIGTTDVLTAVLNT